MKRRPGRGKHAVFFGLLGLAMVAVLEAASALVLLVRDGGLPSPPRWRQLRQRAAQESGDPAGVGPGLEAGAMQVLHPFVGYVLNPAFKGIPWREVDSQGFQSPPGAVEPPAGSPRFVVAVFGGSVAGGFCLEGREFFVPELRRSPNVQGKAIVVRCFAMGGYKQPQQLMALNYTLSLGEQVDLAVNLDGFNEAALPIAENLKEGINPFYPRGWATRVAGAPSIDALRIIGRITLWKDERLRRADLCAAPPLAWSPTCHLVWSTLDRRLAWRIFEAQQELGRLEPRDRGFLARGPSFDDVPRPQLCRLLAEHWARSSTLMFELARARGISYVHFLQPNQYVPGSKPMGREEQLAAVSPTHPYRSAIEDCYPSLIEAGKGLAARGVPFHDLTGVFAGHPEPLYVDVCCHYNRGGQRVVATTIGRLVVEALARRPRAAGGGREVSG